MVNKEGAKISEASFRDSLDAHSREQEGGARTLEVTPTPSQREGRGSDDCFFLKIPKTCGSPGVFFASEDDSRSQGKDQKKKSGRDRNIKEVVGKPKLGARRAISLKEINLKTPKTGGSTGDFFANQDKKNSEESLTKKNWEGTRVSRRG